MEIKPSPEGLAAHEGQQSSSRDISSPGEARGSKTGPRAHKRTKTGCLTCRKRRIKCGEERPICRNCTKSKRICEGYSQRLAFRDAGTWPAGSDTSDSTLMYHNGGMPGTAVTGARQPPPPPLNLASAEFVPGTQYIATHTPYSDVSSWGYDTEGRPVRIASSNGPLTPQVPPSAGPYATTMPGGMPHFAQPTPQSLASDSRGSDTYFTMNPYQHMVSATEHDNPYGRRSSTHEPVFDYHYPGDDQRRGSLPYPMPNASNNSRMLTGQQGEHFHASQDHYRPLPATISASPNGHHMRHQSVMANEHWSQHGESDVHRLWADKAPTGVYESPSGLYDHRISALNYTADSNHFSIPQYKSAESDLEPRRDVSRADDFLLAAAVENQDDEYYDVESEDDAYLITANSGQRDLGVILTLHQQNISDLSMRHYDAFIFQGVLDRYHADHHASPLKNEMTARVFLHFITATGPSLGIFERNPRNGSAIFAESALPLAQQSLWTHSIPMMALNNQGLLHAILALSSLHIANLQGASTTPSIKHYMFALKRVHKAVGSDRKRHYITTLAATLLLGYYEVMTADHAKWCSHLSGARQLLLELDYRAMTQEAIRLEGQERAAAVASDLGAEHTLTPHQTSPDEHLIDTIVGRKPCFDDSGRVFSEANRVPAMQGANTSSTQRTSTGDHVPSQLDLQSYRIYQDLWWWFARQDAYQSIVSGNRLLMDFARWSHCPPRARIGRDDAAYGTHDHIVLLLARIADFSATDRKRKLAAVDVRGGSWRPPTGGNFKGLGDLTITSPRRGPPGRQPQQPPFMGMAPSSNKAFMPSSYGHGTVVNAWPESPGSEGSPIQTSASQNIRLEKDLSAAIQEWLNIRSALEILGSHLGPRFQPMDATYSGSGQVQSPFGPALCFQKFDVAVLNAMYHMLRIILYRAHPEMPPASMVASSVAASFTREAVNKIGQIAAGIFALAGLSPAHAALRSHQKPLNPSIGGMLCEVSMPLFFAGVQLQAQDQRSWLVDHLYELEVRTGFATAGMIGHGCETAWKRTGDAGQGPPYRRSGHWRNRDEVVDRDPTCPPAAWAQGVRGFEEDSMPLAGVGINDLPLPSRAREEHRAELAGIPVRQCSVLPPQSLPDSKTSIHIGERETDMLRRLHILGDRTMEAH